MIERDTEFKPQFRAELLGTLMTALFVKQHALIKKEIQAIILINGTLAFRYKSKSYITDNCPNYTEKFELDHHHRDAMDNILSRQQCIEKDYILIDAYLTRAMNQCKTVAQLYQVIPEQLHQYFPDYVKKHYTQQARRLLPSDQVDQFLVENESAYNSLKIRLLTIMVLN